MSSLPAGRRTIAVRLATVANADDIARVQVRAWQTAYRGHMRYRLRPAGGR